ncbi:hypothetical protein [Candidatus Nitrotoga sp. AM1P]
MAVAEELYFARAAEKLHIERSSLLHNIKELVYSREPIVSDCLYVTLVMF